MLTALHLNGVPPFPTMLPPLPYSPDRERPSISVLPTAQFLYHGDQSNHLHYSFSPHATPRTSHCPRGNLTPLFSSWSLAPGPSQMDQQSLTPQNFLLLTVSAPATAFARSTQCPGSPSWTLLSFRPGLKCSPSKGHSWNI